MFFNNIPILKAEVEAFIRQNEHVVDAYCFGIPDERTGEEVCLWVKLKPDSVGKCDEKALRAFCDGKIAYYKIPRHIKIVDSFPISANGKAQKFKMTKAMLDELQQQSKAKNK